MAKFGLLSRLRVRVRNVLNRVGRMFAGSTVQRLGMMSSRSYSRGFGDLLAARGVAFGDDGSSRARDLVSRLSRAGQQTIARVVRNGLRSGGSGGRTH